MKVRGVAVLFLMLAVGGASVQAQVPSVADTAGLRNSLTEMLSVLTLGGIAVPDQSVQVSPSGSPSGNPSGRPSGSPSGADVTLRLPLKGLVAPADAVAQAVAHPDGNGVWTITSMAFPSSGAIGNSIDKAQSYTIGQQSIHGQLDATLATPSTLAAELGLITLQTTGGKRETAQAIDRIALDGRMSANSAGGVDLLSQNAATNWHAIIRDPAGAQGNSFVQHVTGRLTMSDLDRAQGSRLLAAARSFNAVPGSAGQPRTLSPGQRDSPRRMLDAATGLLSKFDADETLDAAQFDLGNGNAGGAGRLGLHLQGGVQAQQLNATMELAIDGLALTMLPADSAGYMPHHLTAKAILAGVPTGPLMALLRQATAANPDPVSLQQQATALLALPGVRAGIDSMAFDSGPLQVQGSAQMRPRLDGEAGVDIHITARGTEALLSQLQNNADLQGVMPLIFLAKGLGRVQGDSLVWDISLGGGPLTVNGVPFGQPMPSTR